MYFQWDLLLIGCCPSSNDAFVVCTSCTSTRVCPPSTRSFRLLCNQINWKFSFFVVWLWLWLCIFLSRMHSSTHNEHTSKQMNRTIDWCSTYYLHSVHTHFSNWNWITVRKSWFFRWFRIYFHTIHSNANEIQAFLNGFPSILITNWFRWLIALICVYALLFFERTLLKKKQKGKKNKSNKTIYMRARESKHASKWTNEWNVPQPTEKPSNICTAAAAAAATK